MICEVCHRDRPLTYRAVALRRKSVCARCIREHYPETLCRGEATVEWQGWIRS